MNALDQLLADTAHVHDLDPSARSKSREALKSAIDQHGPGPRSDRPLYRRKSVRRRLRIGGLVAAAAVAAITLPVLSVSGLAPSEPASAAAVLRQAGKAAGSQPGGWPDAAYWHVVSTYTRDGRRYQRDIWIAHHGESVLYDRGLPGNPGVITLGSTGATFDAAQAPISWDQLYALPTSPRQLADTLRRTYGAGADNTQWFAIAADLLRETPASPALRQALYELAATSPGVRVTGNVTDSAGRAGTAVELNGETLVIDTQTGQLLDDTEGSGFSATYLSQGPTNTAPPPRTR